MDSQENKQTRSIFQVELDWFLTNLVLNVKTRKKQVTVGEMKFGRQERNTVN